ncbi:hypothetical protein Q4566_15770 [Tamlana sp. 2_MG-2023]|uniref:hypothetical protein n=1 Tax=unclassified Tamlana TaxID=2614803 RepID=UPI0026E32E38|nr:MULTISPECIES: hypothetical protein [unclassified Tamlana]MDO6761665.1 hypothetical protein [Tamlana sp. 2_MG-2023]MDO6792491.1 hypothetical protein [Tamlana sp. 1_MG-2023]
MKKSYDFRKKEISEKALIIGFNEEFIVEEKNSDSYFNYMPIVAFIDKSGKEIIQELDSSRNNERLNEHINIIYLKTVDGYDILVDHKWERTYFPLAIVSFGILLMILAFFIQ